MKANKNLGQHFLVNKGVISKIVDRVENFVQNKEEEWVFEIGPGQGAITDELLERGLRVYAFDLDQRMIELLEKKHQNKIQSGQFKLMYCDVTRDRFANELNTHNCRTVCGNLPYNVGTEIVVQLYENFPQVENFCFMLQKEVVDRFLGEFNSKAYSPLSIRWTWGTRLIDRFLVKAGSFSPPPEVESAVFSYQRKAGGVSPHENKLQYTKYTQILKTAFSQRRKMLRKNLPQLADSQWATLRAEQVSPDEFLNICHFLEE